MKTIKKSTKTTLSTRSADRSAVPPVVDRATFQAEVDKLRVREKAHTHEGDAIAAARRRLPMVEVNAATALVGKRGAVTLLDAFEGRGQLIAYYFMWYPGKPAPEQCEGCTWVTSQVRELSYVHSRDVTFAVFCQGRTKRAPAIVTSWDGKCPGTQPRTLSRSCYQRRNDPAECTWCAICVKERMSSRPTGPQSAASKRWITTIDYWI